MPVVEEPSRTIPISVIPERLAGINEVCEGFNESTGQPYPGCEEGLVCVDSGIPSIPGAGNVCKHDFGCFFG